MYKELFHNKKAVIFDLDGTLADTHHLWDTAVLNVLRSIGIFTDEIGLPRGMHISDKWEALMQNTDGKTPFTKSELIKHTYNEYLKLFGQSGIQVKDGFWSFAAELKVDKQIKLGMVTNTVREVGVKVIEILGLAKAFEVEVYSDEIKKPKPDPEIYKTAAHKLQLKSKDILVFEDSVVGAQSAVSAGMDTVVIWDGLIMRKDYPKEVKGFVPDYTPFPGNMDDTFLERFKRFVQDKAKGAENEGTA